MRAEKPTQHFVCKNHPRCYSHTLRHQIVVSYPNGVVKATTFTAKIRTFKTRTESAVLNGVNSGYLDL